MTNTKELHQLNVVQNRLLNKENKEYYMKMASYIRTSDISSYDAEGVLAEMVDHLVFAQMDGKKTSDVFGHNPKRYCDELMKELPLKSVKERIKQHLFLFLFSFMAVLFYSFFQLNNGISLYDIVESFVLFGLLQGLKYLLHTWSFYGDTSLRIF